MGRQRAQRLTGCVSVIGQTSASILILRLFSADWTLDPLALAPGRFPTEATYVPPDSSKLPE